MKTHLFLLCLLAPTVLHAGPRASASYNLLTDTHNAGGTRSASTSYTNNGSIGEIAGVSTVAAPAESTKAGYMAQLYEVTALQLAASPATINESGARQLAGSQLLDDLTTLAVPATSIAWSIQSGPLSIDANGLATAATVYQNTTAVVQGSYLGISSTLGLTVLDTFPDNYGVYAGDGIGDDWQTQYFGLNNASAAPLLDPDHDGQSNLLEFATGQAPNSPSVLGRQIKFNATLLEYTYPRSLAALNSGLQYTVEWSDTLSNDWQSTNVSEIILSDNGTMQQVKATIPAGNGGRRFAHLKVTAAP